jgi:hypothetical protein
MSNALQHVDVEMPVKVVFRDLLEPRIAACR